jgi:hypothetical protein
LVKVVVGVDQAREQDVAAGVERFRAGLRRLLPGSEDFLDFSGGDHHAARGVEAVAGEGCERAADPEPRTVLRRRRGRG